MTIKPKTKAFIQLIPKPVYEKTLSVLFFLSSVFGASAQSLAGKYVATELAAHRVDKFGKLHYYIRQTAVNNKWFFDVTVTIVDNRISVAKRYVFVDEKGRRAYADSNISTLNYVGTLTPVDGRYIATTKLTGRPALFPYFEGKSTRVELMRYEEIRPTPKDEQATFQFHKYTDGQFWVYKEMVSQDLVIRPEEKGIWINNQFYRQVE